MSNICDRFASCGVLILFVTSFPMSLDKGAGLPGLIVALVLIGLGSVYLIKILTHNVKHSC